MKGDYYVQRKEEAKAFVIFSWNLLQEYVQWHYFQFNPLPCDILCMEGGGVYAESCWRPCTVLQYFNTLYVTRFGTYQISCPPQDKNLVGEGTSTDNQLPLLLVPFYRLLLIKTKRFCVAIYGSYPSTGIIWWNYRQKRVGIDWREYCTIRSLRSNPTFLNKFFPLW